MMPAVDFEGIEAAALRSARSAIGDTEVVATARAIGRVLQGAGRDWHDLVKALLPTPAPSDAADLSSEKSTIWWHHLTLRDRQFIENLTDRHKSLSPKQQKWLCDIREKPERGAAA
jgi:hypothetical protein